MEYAVWWSNYYFHFNLPYEFVSTLEGKDLPFWNSFCLTLMHAEWPKLYGVMAFLSAVGLRMTVLLPTEVNRQSQKLSLMAKMMDKLGGFP